jgi:hypothetical protein
MVSLNNPKEGHGTVPGRCPRTAHTHTRCLCGALTDYLARPRHPIHHAFSGVPRDLVTPPLGRTHTCRPHTHTHE